MDNRELFIKMGSITLNLMIEIISNPSMPINKIEERYFNTYGYTFNKAFYTSLISQVGIILNGDALINDKNYDTNLYLKKIELAKALFSSFKINNELIVNKEDLNAIFKKNNFKNTVSFISFVKDKLQNGMFEYDFFKDGIIIGGEMIPYKFLDLCSTCIFADHLVKDNPGYVDFNIVKIDPGYQTITGSEKIDSIINNIKIIKIKITPKNEEYLSDDLNYRLYEKLIKIRNYDDHSSTSLSSLYDELLEIVQDNNLNYSHQIVSLSDISIDSRNELIKFINNNGEIFYSSTVDTQKHYLIRLVHLLDMHFHDYLNEGIFLLRELKNYMGKSFSFNDIKRQNMDYSLNDNQLLISLVFMKFYIIYAYNRENEYDDYLDYSALDLSIIDSRINDPLLDDKILNRNYDALTNIELLLLKRKRLNDNSKERYADLKVKNGRLFKHLENDEFAERSRVIKNFKLEPLNKDILYNTLLNRSILMHIKNSICNGTISFNKFATEKNSSIITFSDYQDGKLSYIGSVSFKDLAALCDYNLIKNNLKKNEN